MVAGEGVAAGTGVIFQISIRIFKWWKTATRELESSALVFVFGFAIAFEVKTHWHWSIYVFMAWYVLLLFSRLAIWITLVELAGMFVVGSLAKVLADSPEPLRSRAIAPFN